MKQLILSCIGFLATSLGAYAIEKYLLYGTAYVLDIYLFGCFGFGATFIYLVERNMGKPQR